MVFEVSMEGGEVGQDTFAFDYTGDTLIVERSVRLDVSCVFINFLSYRHRSTGYWRNGQLDKLIARTRQNGERRRVRAVRSGESMAIKVGEDKTRTDERVIQTSWWNPGITESPILLDTQFGTFRTVTVTKSARRPDAKVMTPWWPIITG